MMRQEEAMTVKTIVCKGCNESKVYDEIGKKLVKYLAGLGKTEEAKTLNFKKYTVECYGQVIIREGRKPMHLKTWEVYVFWRSELIQP